MEIIDFRNVKPLVFFAAVLYLIPWDFFVHHFSHHNKKTDRDMDGDTRKETMMFIGTEILVTQLVYERSRMHPEGLRFMV